MRNQIGTCLCIIILLPAVLHGDRIDIATTDPIVFGGNVTLECVIMNQIDMTHVAWLKGEYGDVLTRTFTSSNSTKYIATMISTNKCSTYQLTITSLNEFDVNTEYRCTYGFKSLSVNLSTTHYAFIYIPKRGDVLATIDMGNTKINVSIIIQQVYPEPTCTILYEEKSLTSEPVVAIKRHKLFYEVTFGFWFNIYDKKCHGTLSLQCKIGESEMDIFEKDITFCEDTKFQNIPAWMVGLIAVVSVIAILFAVIIFKFRHRAVFASCRHIENSSNIENIDTVQTLLKQDETVKVK